MNPVYEHFRSGFQDALARSRGGTHRIGAELKFPLVDHEGPAVSYEKVRALWEFLLREGWHPVTDSMPGRCVGARTPGPFNDTVASCETGYCKTEFSLAHVATIHELAESLSRLRTLLHRFGEKEKVLFLGYGIQPVTPPSAALLMKKTRTGVWEKVFPSNEHIAKEDGDDVHLFTVNAATHVHVGLPMEEAIPALNVLNGFAGAQIGLTAHSNVWRGQLDKEHQCVSEIFWDWWMGQTGRVGVPKKPFRDLEDYVRTVASFRPVYVKRNGKPILLTRYPTFSDYYKSSPAVGTDAEGREVSFLPEKQDIDLHNSCYWFNARLSRYYTVENRTNDQQPPDALAAVAAVTIGILSALNEAQEVLGEYGWGVLRSSRKAACRDGLGGRVDGVQVVDLSATMLAVARLGLERRGLGEECFLAPFERRLSAKSNPANETQTLFQTNGIGALLEARSL